MIKRSLYSGALFILIFTLYPTLTFAQHDVIPDRPGIGDSPFTYSTGIFGAETGIQYIDGGSGEYQFPQLLLRYGVSEKVELRFNAGSVAFADGLADGQVQQQSAGFKYEILAEQGRYLTFMTMIDLPFLNSNYSSWGTTFTMLGRVEGDTNWALDSNVGMTVPDLFGGGSGSVSFNFNLTPGYNFNNPANSGVYFGYATNFSSDFDIHYFELGFTILTAPNIQLDINSAKNLFQQGYFIGAGFAVAL